MNAINLLNKYGLSKTQGRIEILNILLESEVALAEKEIQEKLDSACDRATIYRTLKKFTETGILHPVATEGTVTKYVIKKEPEEHLHFSCVTCGKTYCLTNVKIEGYELPKGFKKSDSNFLVTGTCYECNL
jgi:Fur family ferric uptake transcriptional regulator